MAKENDDSLEFDFNDLDLNDFDLDFGVPVNENVEKESAADHTEHKNADVLSESETTEDEPDIGEVDESLFDEFDVDSLLNDSGMESEEDIHNEVTASPQEETIMVSATPMVTPKSCSIISGTIKFRRALLENTFSPHFFIHKKILLFPKDICNCFLETK